MKTLFLKSNLLHIRTNEGEFEVSNPKDIVDTLIYDAECDIWWLRVLNSDEEPVEFTESSKIEWPGGVELIEVDTVEDGGGCYVAGSKTVARLIQEEMWKKHIQQEELWDDAISIGESEKSRKSAIHKIMKRFTITRNP